MYGASGSAPSIFLTPRECLPNHFVLIGASEMPQEPVGNPIVNERRKRADLWASPGVQLDRKVSVIDAALKRWRIPHLYPTDAH